MRFIEFLAMKFHQGPAFISGMVNLIVVVGHSMKNFVKFLQNKLLFQKLFIVCVN